MQHLPLKTFYSESTLSSKELGEFLDTHETGRCHTHYSHYFKLHALSSHRSRVAKGEAPKLDVNLRRSEGLLPTHSDPSPLTAMMSNLNLGSSGFNMGDATGTNGGASGTRSLDFFGSLFDFG